MRATTMADNPKAIWNAALALALDSVA